MKYLLTLAMLLFASCASMNDITQQYDVHGKIKKSERKVDGITDYKLYATWTYPIEGEYSTNKLGAFYTKDQMGKEKYYITAETMGADTFTSITFKVDGKKYTLKPYSLTATHINSSGSEGNLYPVTANASFVKIRTTRKFLEILANANQVFVKFSYLKTYSEFTITLNDASKSYQDRIKANKGNMPWYVGDNYQNNLKTFIKVTSGELREIPLVYDFEKRQDPKVVREIANKQSN